LALHPRAQLHLNLQSLAGMAARLVPERECQATHIAVAARHAGQAHPTEQKGQRIAQVELLIDGRQQQHDHHHGKAQAAPAGHDVNVALREGLRVSPWCTSFTEGLPALSQFQGHRGATVRGQVGSRCGDGVEQCTRLGLGVPRV